MKLDAVLALHPGPDSDSSALAAAIMQAETRRAELLANATAADQRRADGLLSADERTMAAAERDAAAARLGADRIAALLPSMRADLAAARGQETVRELRVLARALEQKIAAVREWQDRDLPRLAELIGAGLHVEHEALTAFAAFTAAVEAAFARIEVRDAAPGGFAVPPLDGPRPSVLFCNWERPVSG